MYVCIKRIYRLILNGVNWMGSPPLQEGETLTAMTVLPQPVRFVSLSIRILTVTSAPLALILTLTTKRTFYMP